jgi:tetratricopeptide (TPR) repeat protein
LLVLAGALFVAGLFDWGPKLEKSFASLTHSEVRGAYGFVEFAPLTLYMNSIGEPLGAVSPRKNIKYRYYIVRMPIENAFATGAGYQYITTGMLEVSDTADEVAGIMAHETAHNADKHVIQNIKDQFGVTALYLSLSKKMSDDQQILFGVLANLRSLRYSRKDEYKADDLGTRYMSQAGFNPYYFMTSFQKLEAAHPTGRMSKLEISFSSHPRTTDRIQRINNQIQALEKDPSASYALGQKLYERGFFIEAKSFLQKAMEQKPEHTEAQMIVARIEASIGRRDERGSPPADGAPYGTVLAATPLQRPDFGGLISAVLSVEGDLTFQTDRNRGDLERALTTLEDVGSGYDAFTENQKEFFGTAAQAESELESLHAQDRAVLLLARKTRAMLEKTKEIPTLSPGQLALSAQCVAEVTGHYRHEEVPEARELSGMITAFHSYSRSPMSAAIVGKQVASARRKREARQKWVNRAYECSAEALAFRISDFLYLLSEERPEETIRYMKTAGLLARTHTGSFNEWLGRPDTTKQLLSRSIGGISRDATDPIRGATDREALWAYLNLVFGDLFRMYSGPQYQPDTTLYIRVSEG